MSNVSNCVLHIGHAPSVTKEIIEGKVFVGCGGARVEQSFLWVPVNDFESPNDADLAGGSVAFESGLYLAAFNYVYPEEVCDWFESLPWQPYDEAVLSISGNDRSFIVVHGEQGLVPRLQIMS